MLTSHPQKANDLAQDAWVRVLRARHTLKTSGNFPAFINTVATNLWRDARRSARAGKWADGRRSPGTRSMLPFSTGDGDAIVLIDTLPDLKSLQADEVR